MNDKIRTLHPDPDKSGVNISQAKYELVREAIVSVLEERGEFTFTHDEPLLGTGYDAWGYRDFGWEQWRSKIDIPARTNTHIAAVLIPYKTGQEGQLPIVIEQVSDTANQMQLSVGPSAGSVDDITVDFQGLTMNVN